MATDPATVDVLAVPTRVIGDTKIPYEVLRYIPQESSEHYKIAPLGIVEGALEVGLVDPDDIEAIDAVPRLASAIRTCTFRTAMPTSEAARSSTPRAGRTSA